jgi:hypothetical protein
VLYISSESARTTRKRFTLPNGTGFWKTDYLQIDHEKNPSPQAFLIEQDPDQDVQSHFHEQSEYQLIVGGDGQMGRNDVRPVMIHYANAYTGYGPIRAGSRGVQYVTLRPMRDNGALWLPEDRPKMKPAPKKFYHSAPLELRSAAALATLNTPVVTTIIEHPDGMASWTIALGPHQSTAIPDPRIGGGQYLLLLGGTVTLNDARLHRDGCAFVSADEPAAMLNSGAEGAEIAVLQFPRAEYLVTYRPADYRYAAQE